VRKLQEEIPEVIVPALYLFSRHHTRQTTQNHTKWRPAVAVLGVSVAGRSRSPIGTRQPQGGMLVVRSSGRVGDVRYGVAW
jgi:hypothetical protein